MVEGIPKTTVRIVGTSHIGKKSAQEVRNAFNDFKPDIVAVELDRRRLESLEARARGEEMRMPKGMVGRVGITGYLFILLGGWLQKKLGGIVKVDPGVDMLEAVKVARENEVKVALVDQDVLIVMRKLRMSPREIVRFVWDLLSSPFRKKLRFRLDEVPSKELIAELMGMMRDRYPSIYKPLVLDRNVHMAMQIDRISRNHAGQKVLLVVGAGHEEDLTERLERSERIAISS